METEYNFLDHASLLAESMMYRELPEDLLQAVDLQDLRAYAQVNGWKHMGDLDGRFTILSHPDSDLDQVLVPLNVHATDYGRRIGDAVQSLAEREVRPTLEVLDDILSGSLQPAEEPRPDLFVGYVDALNGEMAEDGRVRGEVTLLLLHEDTPIRARVDLSADQYRTANDAHMTGGVVAVRGILYRGRRVHHLGNVSSFQRVEGGPSSSTGSGAQ